MIRAVIADLRLLVEAGRVIASSAHPLPETQNKARVAVTQGVILLGKPLSTLHYQVHQRQSGLGEWVQKNGN
jgi:hypothetical protein